MHLPIAGILAGIGTVVSAVGTIAAGQAQQRAANFQAAQEEVQAKEERAAAQQQGFDIARQKRLALSRNQAVGAASGFGADDTSSLDIAGEIAAYGTWQEQVANYGGESRASSLNASAAATRESGRAAMTGAYIGAAGTLVGGFADTLYKKYGSAVVGPGAPATSLRYG